MSYTQSKCVSKQPNDKKLVNIIMLILSSLQHQAPAAFPSVTSYTQQRALLPQTPPQTPHAADSLSSSETTGIFPFSV